MANGKRQGKKDGRVTDAELARRFYREKTHGNFNALWERYYFGLKKYAYGMLKDEDSAKDAVVETFSNAWTKRDTFEPDKGAFSTWVYRICRNICLGRIDLKRRGACIDHDISDCYDSVLANAAEDLTVEDDGLYMVDEETGSLEHMTRDDIIKKMYDVSVYEMGRLENEKMRRVLSEKLINDKKIREIAEEEETHMSNVKNRLYTGKALLMDVVKRKYPRLFEIYQSVAM